MGGINSLHNDFCFASESLYKYVYFYKRVIIQIGNCNIYFISAGS